MKRGFLTFLSLLFLSLVPLTAQEKQEPLVSFSSLYLYSSNYILIEAKSGLVLNAQNENKQIHPASITKVLTMITALELLEGQSLMAEYTLPEEVFTGLHYDASIAGFEIGDTFTLEDIFYAMNLPSGADATRAISMYLTGSPEGLAEEMNKLAQRIGMKDSHFVNTSGLDDENHYSTSHDLALLIQYAIKNSQFMTFYGTTDKVITSKEGRVLELENASLSFMRSHGYSFILGAKSGYTELAQRCLSSVAEKDGLKLIFVSTQAPYEETPMTAALDAMSVYDHVFTNYRSVKAITAQENLAEVTVHRGSRNITIQSDEDINVILPIDYNPDDLSVSFTPNVDRFEAPLAKDTLLGSIQIRYQEQELFTKTIMNQEEIDIKWTYILLHYTLMILGLIFIALFSIFAFYFIRHELRRHRRTKQS